MGDKDKLNQFTQLQKIHKIGGSLMVVLPSEFVDATCIKDGDEIGVYVDKKAKVFRVFPIPPPGVEPQTLSEESGLLIKTYAH